MEMLKADYVGMLGSAEAFVKLAYRLLCEISKLKLSFRELDIFWDGMANTQFRVMLEGDFLEMEAICLRLRRAGVLLKNAVEEYVAVEKSLNDMIGGL